jgi:transcriptional regulator with XRE-family HTH domain
VEKRKISRLKVFRIAAGLTQAQLADISGTYQENLSRIERGGTSVIVEREALAAALGVSIEVLFGDRQ